MDSSFTPAWTPVGASGLRSRLAFEMVHAGLQESLRRGGRTTGRPCREIAGARAIVREVAAQFIRRESTSAEITSPVWACSSTCAPQPACRPGVKALRQVSRAFQTPRSAARNARASCGGV